MTEYWQFLTDFLQQHEMQLMAWSMPTILLVLAILLGLPMLRSQLENRTMLRKIRKLGRATLNNVVVPDGIGGTVFLEHVVLHPDGIFILPVRRYQGAVFAADKIDSWTQVTGRRSYKFPNPLPELESAMLAVRNITPNVTVEGRLLVTQEATFPKGKPEAVISFSEATQRWEAGRKGTISADLQAAWTNLKENANSLDRQLRQEVLEPGRGIRNNLTLAGIMILAAAAWLVWRFS